jgi:hypothetical protein
MFLGVSRFWCIRFRTVLTARMAQTRRIVDNDAIRQLCYMNEAPEAYFAGFRCGRARTLIHDILDIIW